MDLRDYKNVGHDRHFWHEGRRIFIYELCWKFLRPGSPRRLLEIGCGTGTILGLLSEFGQASGIELESEAAGLARSAGMDVSVGDIGECALPPNEYDAIFLFDVLEHLRDDAGAISKAAGSLKSGGTLILTVPAYPSLYGPHDRSLGHLRRYERSFIEALAAKAKLDIVASGYWNTLLFPLEAAWRIFFRAIEKTGLQIGRGSDAFKMPHLINKVLLSILSFESRHALGRFWPRFGMTIFIVARKNG